MKLKFVFFAILDVVIAGTVTGRIQVKSRLLTRGWIHSIDTIQYADGDTILPVTTTWKTIGSGGSGGVTRTKTTATVRLLPGRPRMMPRRKVLYTLRRPTANANADAVTLTFTLDGSMG
jgi:hypothetical protein